MRPEMTNRPPARAENRGMLREGGRQEWRGRVSARGSTSGAAQCTAAAARVATAAVRQQSCPGSRDGHGDGGGQQNEGVDAGVVECVGQGLVQHILVLSEGHQQVTHRGLRGWGRGAGGRVR